MERLFDEEAFRRPPHGCILLAPRPIGLWPNALKAAPDLNGRALTFT